MGFREVVRRSGLAPATASSSLKRLTKMGIIGVTLEGKRPVYRLADQDLAEKLVIRPEIKKRLSRLVKLLPRLGQAAAVVRTGIDRPEYKETQVPAALRKFEDWAWSKVPEGVAYEDYWGYHPPSVMALIYAVNKHPRLLQEQLLRREEGNLERMLTELKKIVELERFVQREKARIRSWARAHPPPK
jgi:hypothetical protein